MKHPVIWSEMTRRDVGAIAMALGTAAVVGSSRAFAQTASSADLAVFGAGVLQKLEQVAGVSRVIPKEHRDNKLHFTVDSLEGRHIRPGLAKAVIDGGWGLNELHAVGLSLEEIFLQLTADADSPKTTPAPTSETSGAAGEKQ